MTIKTGNFAIHLTSDGHLLEVSEGIPVRVALNLAGDLGEAVQLLTDRIYDAINVDNDIAYACEMRAIGLLSEIASALTRSAAGGLSREGEA